jgi:HAD superfamily hydrolase (TIGR01549 family)
MEKHLKAKGFAEARIAAGSQTINGVYDKMPLQFKKFKETEINFEKTVIRKNPEIFELYKYALNKGKKIIFISDMYLPAAVIDEILDRTGYAIYDKLYVSSNYGKTKSSSELYQVVIKDLKIAPQKILHIGDNYNSDVKQARNSGLHAVRYPNFINRFFENADGQKFRIFYNKRKKDLTSSIIVSMAAYRRLKNRSEKDNEEKYWLNYGYEIGGSLAYGFCKFIENEATNGNFKNTVFVARDGYALQKVFDTFQTDIRTYYVYMSRLLTMYCGNYIKENPDRLERLDYFFKYLSFKHLNNIQKEFASGKEIKEFILNNKMLLKIISTNRDNYKRYFESKFDINNNYIVVDTGTATCFSAQTLLQDFSPNSTVLGLYAYVYPLNQKSRNYKQFTNNAFNVRIIEFTISAPKMSAVNVDENGNAVYDDRPDKTDPRSNRIIKNYVCNGILDFAKDIKDLFQGILPNDLFDNALYIDLVNAYVENASLTDIIYRSKAKHVGSFNFKVRNGDPVFRDKLTSSLFGFIPIKSTKFNLKILEFSNKSFFMKVKSLEGQKFSIRLFGFIPIMSATVNHNSY